MRPQTADALAPPEPTKGFYSEPPERENQATLAATPTVARPAAQNRFGRRDIPALAIPRSIMGGAWPAAHSGSHVDCRDNQSLLHCRSGVDALPSGVLLPVRAAGEPQSLS